MTQHHEPDDGRPELDEVLEWLLALADSGDGNAAAAARQGFYDRAAEHMREANCARRAIALLEEV